MRRFALLAAVAALLVSLPVVAERVRLSTWSSSPITLDGMDVIYVKEGWMEVGDDHHYLDRGYKSYRAYALDCLSYRLFIDDVEIEPTVFHAYKDKDGHWHASWSFVFRPRSLEAGTFEFAGLYWKLAADGTEYTLWMRREVTIEYE